MKKIKIFILAAIFGLVACSEDFLDKVPTTSMSDRLALSNYNNMQLATNACYAYLYSSNYYGRAFVIIPEIRGVNAKSSNNKNSGRFQTNYNWAENGGNTSGLWGTAYGLITSASNVINAVEGYSEPGVTQAQLDQIKGEAMFLRAMAHFDLVRMYAQPYSYAKDNPDVDALGIPIITKTEIGSPARDKVTDVYKFIVAQLRNAEQLVGDPGRGNAPKAFASKEAVQALLAKVYMYMENWDSAAYYANTVITSGKFSLVDANEYTQMWSSEEGSSEVIFMVYGNATQSFYPSYNEIGYILNPDGYGDVVATEDLRNLFDPADVRGQLFNNYGFADEAWPTKYPGKTKVNENNIIVLRLAEMYLIRAEAALNGAAGFGNNSALNDYNTLREHRGLSAASSVTLEDIYTERRRELNFEPGNGFWDISRLQRDVQRTDVASEIAPKTITFPDHRFALPIPISEIEANNNMVQNPGYN